MEDRHYCLKLFEDIHQKYNLQECDYKEFVEALGGKKKEIEANVEEGFINHQEFGILFPMQTGKKDL